MTVLRYRWVQAAIAVAAVAVVVLIVAVVRGSDDSVDRSPAPQASVSAGPGLQFSDAVLRVPVGAKVTFRNADSTAHTFTADGGLFDSGPVQPGASFTFSFAAAGELAYHCEIHPSMKARVVVEGEG